MAASRCPSHHLSRRPSRALTASGGTVLALALLTGCGASADDAEPETRTFGPVTRRLTITKDNGDLAVRPADVGEVRVTRRFARWSMIGSRPKATWELTGNRLTLATDCGTIIGGCEVRYEVVVPRSLALSVEGQNGRISVTGVSAPLSLKSENGALHAIGTRSARVRVAARPARRTVRRVERRAPAAREALMRPQSRAPSRCDLAADL